MEKIEGRIYHASYDRSFNVDIQLEINKEIYNLFIPRAGSVYKLQENLDTNQRLRLKGLLDAEEKVIKEPQDIWVKIF